MTDQMPERVRLGRWPGGRLDFVEDSDEDGTDYIRADLYEQAEADRDRLRAAVSEAKRRIGICMDDECSYDETLEMGGFVLDAFRGLQEALDHD